MIRKKDIEHPICVNIGCNRLVRKRDEKASGNISYKNTCSRCYRLQNQPDLLRAEGITQVKKDYCENINGKLGFACTASDLVACQLELDHIDGDCTHNVPNNIQTLCANCHSRKTVEHKDCDSNRSNIYKQEQLVA